MILVDVNFLIHLFIETGEEHNIANKIYENIKNQQLIIANSVILEVMTVSNVKLKVSKEKLEEIYNTLQGGKFEILDDMNLYDNTFKRQISYLPERLPFFDCLYLELMEQLGIKRMVTFDKHFDNKGIEVIGN
jgi:predicted nucleic acid-binding protein